MSTNAVGRDRGTTLVELMVTLAVMSIAMVMISMTLIMVQRVTNRIEKSSVAIDSARLVSESLDRELRSADCIELPRENDSGNTLMFRTTIGAAGSVMLTYTVDYVLRIVTRAEGSSLPLTLIRTVGPPGTAAAFQQLNTPLRTINIDIPIQSDNGGVFHLVTTIAGRNSWRPCT